MPQYFNTYALFEEYYNNPDKYYNGSLPANVTGYGLHDSRFDVG